MFYRSLYMLIQNNTLILSSLVYNKHGLSHFPMFTAMSCINTFQQFDQTNCICHRFLLSTVWIWNK